MKNILRLLGIIVLAAVVGFSMTTCSEDGGDSGNNGGTPTPTTPTPTTPTPTPTTTTYTVTFDVNGGSGTAPSAQTVQAGSSITLPVGDGLTRTGYTFRGWNTVTSGAGINYDAGASYTVSGNITLYARWLEKDPEGIYVGLIKFAGDAEDLTDGDLILLDYSGKTTLENLLDTKYVIANQSGTACTMLVIT
jgi:uncharacterized repeat protein (TIGR02543 family)